MKKVVTEKCVTYTDNEGYTNIVYESTDEKMMIRYKGNHMDYWWNSELKYSGEFTDEFLKLVNQRLDSGMRSLDESLAQLDRELDKLGNLDTVSLFYSGILPDSSTYRATSYTKTTYSKGSSWGFRLGCLVVSIIILIAICAILYAMGWLGGEVVSFVRDFFENFF